MLFRSIFLLNGGRIVQFRMRQRSIAGAGNGNWHNVNSNNLSDLLSTFESSPLLNLYVKPRGAVDYRSDLDNDGGTFFGSGYGLYTWDERIWGGNELVGTGKGKFNAATNDSMDIAANDICYFQTWGIYSRLNAGGYHPSLNPLGSRKFMVNNGSNNARDWYENDSKNPSTVGDCFQVQENDSDLSSGDQTPFVRHWSGHLNSGNSGRTDDRYYDGAYQGGQGGIIDYRLSAHDMSSKEEAEKVFQKVVNGTYRGEELAVKTKITKWNVDSGDVHSYATLPCDRVADYLRDKYNLTDGGTPVTVPLQCIVYCPSTGYYAGVTSLDLRTTNRRGLALSVGLESNISTGNNSCTNDLSIIKRGLSVQYNAISSGITYLEHYWKTQGGVSGADTSVGFPASSEFYLIEIEPTSHLSDEFEMTDVIGYLHEIYNVPELREGWLGAWIGVSDGSNVDLSRKATDTTGTRISTTNSGSTWASASLSINGVSNRVTTSPTTTWVSLQQYTALAKQTKISDIKPVFNSKGGLGSVYSSEDYRVTNGCTLAESTIGKVMTSNRTGLRYNDNSLTDSPLASNGYPISDDDYLLVHTPLGLVEPVNDSSAIKALWYQTSDNQQLSLNFAYHELYYSSGAFNAWGDNDIIIITNGQGIINNTNGVSCLYGTNELSIPYGYSKNSARTGEQTGGIDL